MLEIAEDLTTDVAWQKLMRQYGFRPVPDIEGTLEAVGAPSEHWAWGDGLPGCLHVVEGHWDEATKTKAIEEVLGILAPTWSAGIFETASRDGGNAHTYLRCIHDGQEMVCCDCCQSLNAALDDHTMELQDFEAIVDEYGLRYVAMAGAVRHGLTQRDLAELVGVAPGTLYRHFQSRKPTCRILARYFAAFRSLMKEPQTDETQLDSGDDHDRNRRLRLDSFMVEEGFERTEGADSTADTMAYRLTKPRTTLRLERLFEVIGGHPDVFSSSLKFAAAGDTTATITLRTATKDLA